MRISISLTGSPGVQKMSKNRMAVMLMLEPMRVWGRENRQIKESICQSNNESNEFVLL